jgi:glucosamine-6-phosphate deaminase
MEVVPLPDPGAVARVAADVVEAQVRGRPDSVLGLATGSTPVPTYDELARRGGVDYDDVTVFILDEYVGLPPGHPQSYLATIRREATDALGIDPGRVHAPDPELLPDAGVAYEQLIASAGGIDLQVLGIGADGHLAFNEPGSSLGSRTRIKTLTAQTRADNARFFDGDAHAEEVPRHALTQGLGTILEARHLVLLATGPTKAAAVAAAVEGPLSASCPASVLQLHPRATVLVDRDAGAGLERWEHYAEVYAGKPAWQGL